MCNSAVEEPGSLKKYTKRFVRCCIGVVCHIKSLQKYFRKETEHGLSGRLREAAVLVVMGGVHLANHCL